MKMMVNNKTNFCEAYYVQFLLFISWGRSRDGVTLDCIILLQHIEMSFKCSVEVMCDIEGRQWYEMVIFPPATRSCMPLCSGIFCVGWLVMR